MNIVYPEGTNKRVMDLFYNMNDNTSINISRLTGVKLNQVNKILTIELSKKVKK